jgi:hypothetical protein
LGQLFDFPLVEGWSCESGLYSQGLLAQVPSFGVELQTNSSFSWSLSKVWVSQPNAVGCGRFAEGLFRRSGKLLVEFRLRGSGMYRAIAGRAGGVWRSESVPGLR